jgi:hypothetical protein
LRIGEMERVRGFRSKDYGGPTYLAGPKQGLGSKETYKHQQDALGNSFNVTVAKHILWNILGAAGLAIGEPTPQTLATASGPTTWCHPSSTTSRSGPTP